MTMKKIYSSTTGREAVPLGDIEGINSVPIAPLRFLPLGTPISPRFRFVRPNCKWFDITDNHQKIMRAHCVAP